MRTYSVTDLTALPESSVPAAFDRGHLYSPTRDITRYALDPSCYYDYRPGDLYEPMPAPPAAPKDYAWWYRNVACEPVPDFLGLRVGDQITVDLVTSVGPGEVIETRRGGAIVRYPYPDPSKSGEMRVRRRNTAGHWYP